MVCFWVYRTPRGQVSIVPTPDGRYLAMFEDEVLGSYHSPASALDDLVGGHTVTPSIGIETDELGLPEELSEWEVARW